MPLSSRAKLLSSVRPYHLLVFLHVLFEVIFKHAAHPFIPPSNTSMCTNQLVFLITNTWKRYSMFFLFFCSCAGEWGGRNTGTDKVWHDKVMPWMASNNIGSFYWCLNPK